MNNSEENTKRAGKTVLICLLVVIVPMFVVSIGSKFIKNHLAVSNAKTMASYAENEFLSNDYNVYLDYLRSRCELSDLTGECKFHFDFDRDYDFESQHLNLHVSFTLHSNEIDNYYTDEFESPNANKLSFLLGKLANSESKSYEYSYSEGSVKIKIGVNNENIDVATSSGRTYNYNTYGYHESVEIDDIPVYIQAIDKADDSHSVTGGESVRCFWCSKVIISNGRYIHCEPIYNGGVVKCDYCKKDTHIS